MRLHVSIGPGVSELEQNNLLPLLSNTYKVASF